MLSNLNKVNNYHKLLAFAKLHGGLWRNSQPKLEELIRNNIQLRNARFFIEMYNLYGFEGTKKHLKNQFKSFDTTNTDMKNRYNKIFNFVNTYHRLKTTGSDFLTERYKKGLVEFLPEGSIDLLK